MNNEDLHMSQTEQMRHELLIRLDEQTKAIARDVQDIKNGYGERLAVLERNKMDKTEYVRLSADESIERGEIKKDVESLKQYRWYMGGAIVVIAVLILPILAWALSQITSIDEKVERSVSAGVSEALSQYETPE